MKFQGSVLFALLSKNFQETVGRKGRLYDSFPVSKLCEKDAESKKEKFIPSAPCQFVVSGKTIGMNEVFNISQTKHKYNRNIQDVS